MTTASHESHAQQLTMFAVLKKPSRMPTFWVRVEGGGGMEEGIPCAHLPCHGCPEVTHEIPMHTIWCNLHYRLRGWRRREGGQVRPLPPPRYGDKAGVSVDVVASRTGAHRCCTGGVAGVLAQPAAAAVNAKDSWPKGTGGLLGRRAAYVFSGRCSEGPQTSSCGSGV
jgi:hypothetical protein